jgi:hypothetical protein
LQSSASAGLQYYFSNFLSSKTLISRCFFCFGGGKKKKKKKKKQQQQQQQKKEEGEEEGFDDVFVFEEKA